MRSISIIVVSYNCWQALAELLDSLSVQTEQSIELIIIDNASTLPQPVDIFDALKHSDIQLIYRSNNNNMGFAFACNQGANLASADHMLFCNPDIKIPPKGLLNLIECYHHSDLQIIGTQLINNNQVVEKHHGSFPTVWRYLPLIGALFKKRYKFTRNDSIEYADWITGAVLLMSSKYFRKLNGWNSAYFMYMEDVDICKRAKEAGWKVGFTTNQPWIHNHGESSKHHPSDRVRSKLHSIISKHQFIRGNFTNKSKPIGHLLVFLKYMPENLILALCSFICPIKELIIRRQLVQQFFMYLYRNRNN